MKNLINDFLSKKLQESTSFIDGDIINDYINEMQKYIKNEGSFKDKIIKITQKFIKTNIKEENMIENIIKNINIFYLDI